MKFLILATLLLVSISFQAAAAAPAVVSKERSRLEALFIWKTSEELKLDAPTEQKFTEIIQSLNSRRRDANAKMDDALAALSKAKSKAEAEKAVKAHRAALREVQAVQTAELDKLLPLLGPEKLAQYITVKNSILEKLKTMLAAPATPTATGPQAPAVKSPAATPSPSPTATPKI